MAFKYLLHFVAIVEICLRPVFCQGNDNCDEFAVQPMDVVENAGGMDFMECEYDDLPLTLFWEKDGTSIGTGLSEPCDCQVTSNGTRSILEFNNISADETGEYTCSVLVGHGDTRRCSANLKLAEAPAFSEKMGPGLVASTTRELSAVVEGDPLPTIEWRFDEQPLAESETFTFTSVILEDGAKTRETLTISDIQPEHRGEYSLYATNTAGNDNVNWVVKVLFGTVTLTKTITSSAIELTCTGEFFTEGDNEIIWERGSMQVVQTGEIVRQNSAFQTDFHTDLHIEQDTCSGPEVVHCTLKYEGASEDIEVTDSEPICDDTVCTPPEVVLVSVGCSTLTLEVIGDPGTYVIFYLPEGSSEWEDDPVVVTSSPQVVIISDLMENTKYDIHAACDSSSTPTAPFVSYTTSSNPPPVTGLYVDIIYNGSGTFSSLTWQPSVADDAESYTITWSSGGDQGPDVIVPISTTRYEWSIVCDVTYVYQVAAVYPCGIGSPSAPVQRECNNVPPAQRIEIEQLKPTTADSDLALLIHFTIDNLELVKTVKVDVLEQNSEFATFQTLNYTIDESTYMNGVVCVGGLTPDAQYLVCLHVEFSDIGRTSTCVRQVAEEGKEEEEEREGTCQLPSYSRRVAEAEDSTGGLAVPDWGIAVIVVGALLMVALIFCFLGLCFACQTSQSKNVTFGSMSSINTERGGNVVPTNMHVHNARAMSPTRSCLKYHRGRGHSTTWNEHIDTLRQMETDKGTHV